VTGRDARVVEVVSWIVVQADPAHHSPGSLVDD
jgi:hypothetical protein